MEQTQTRQTEEYYRCDDHHPKETPAWQFLEPNTIGLTGARLVCRQLGFPYVCNKGVEVVENVTADDIFRFDTRCTGDELSLEDCSISLRQQSVLQQVPQVPPSSP